MFFMIKRKEIVVDAFTYNKSAHDYFPIDTANNFVPEWWKKTPKFVKSEIHKNEVDLPMNTVRRCAGIIDYYNQNNLVIPLWSDLAIDYGPMGYKFAFADMKTSMFHHEQGMRGDFMNQYLHFKIGSCWKFREKTGVKFHFSQLFYNFEDPGKIILPPGIVNYKYQNSTEINFMVRRPVAEQRMILKAGQPLVLLTPLTENKVNIKTHLISKDEYEQQFSWVFSFHNLYNTAKKIKEKKESKCPFHFG